MGNLNTARCQRKPEGERRPLYLGPSTPWCGGGVTVKRSVGRSGSAGHSALARPCSGSFWKRTGFGEQELAPRRFAWLALLPVLLTLAGGRQASATSYSVTQFNVPGATSTYAYGINDGDQIVGNFTSGGVESSFVEDLGTYAAFDVPGATTTAANDINGTDQIVGGFQASDSSLHGFLRTGTTYTVLDVPGAASTTAWGINDAGEVVGQFGLYPTIQGFLKDGDVYTTISFPGAARTIARGINNAGEIAGTYFTQQGSPHGFVTDGSTYTTVDVVADDTYVFGINDAGDLVGQAGGQAFTMDASGTTFFGFGGLSAAYGINNLGDIVGYVGSQSFFAAPTTVPAPGIDALLVTGFLGLAVGRRRRPWVHARL